MVKYFMNLFHSFKTGRTFLKPNRLIEERERFGKLFRPKNPKPISTLPPFYFFRGPQERFEEPNPYLWIENWEAAEARPVPGNSSLLKSICRGKGTLRRSDKGMVYLDIDERFMSMLIPYLSRYGFEQPPYLPHIPVISAREAAFHYLTEIEELGKEFSFEIEGLYSIEPTSWPEMEQVWFFKVRSPDLEDFRRSQFLPPRLGGQAFQIAIAVKPRPTKKRLQTFPSMRINTAFVAA
jgi:hypothetical protein